MTKYVLSVAGRPGSLNEVIWAEGSFAHYKANELESIDGFCMNFKDDAGIKAHLAEVMFSQKVMGGGSTRKRYS